MDLGRSFAFPFADKDWLSKSIVGALVAAVPILNFAWLGYLAELFRNVMAGQDVPLPEWGNFGEKWVRGTIMTIAGLIYSIPALVLACIPLSLLGGFSLREQGLSDQLGAMITGVGGIFTCLIVLYSLALSFFLPAAYIHYARSYEFGALFEFGKIIKIVSAEPGKYVTAWLVSLLAGVLVSLVLGVISMVLGFIPCIGWILAWVIGALAGVYLFYIYGHLFGQVVAGPNAVLPPTSDLMM